MVKIKQVPDVKEHISYKEIEPWFYSVERSDGKAEVIGSFKTEISLLNEKVEEYKIYKQTLGKGIPILLSGGVHGYEISGVHAIIEFMLHEAYKYSDKFEFTTFPCVNPWGFDKMVHENSQYYPDMMIGDVKNKDSEIKYGLNLNREWTENSKAVEINIIKPHLKQYAVHLDLHETWSSYTDKRDKALNDISPDEFFLWETCLDKSLRFGPKIIEAVEKEGIAVCKWPKIYDDTNVNGVISYPEGCGTECYDKTKNESVVTFDAYTNGKHAPQTFTIETPLFEDLEYRVKANIITIKATLDELLKRQKY